MNKSKLLPIGISAIIFLSVVSGQSFARNEDKAEKVKPVVGNVKEVTGNSLTVEEKHSKAQKETQVDTTTKVVGQDRKTLRLQHIKPNDKVAIISSDSAEFGKSKKAIKIFVKQASTSAVMKRRAVHGVVTSMSGNTITLTHQTQQDRNYTVTTSAATSVKIKGTEAGTLASITPGVRIVAFGVPADDGTLLATRIHVIPGKATGVFKRNPLTPGVGTPSASLTPAVTGTITPTVTLPVSPTDLTPSPTLTLTP